MNHKNHSSDKGYKQTEVGVIPEDWSTDKIKSLASITTGSKNTQDRVDSGEYPFFVRSQTVERINSYSFDGEAVLTAGDGVGTGKVFHYIKGKFDFHQRVYKVSDFKDEIDGYYFFLYFSNNFYKRIMQMTAKSSVDSVRMEMIADMQIPLPPTKAEQNAIATALSDADALITSLEKLIAKKRNIKQGAMQKCLNQDSYDLDDDHDFGEAKENHNNQTNHKNHSSDKWVVKKLGEVTDCLDNLRVPLNETQRNQIKGDYPYCGANGVLDFVNDYVIDDDIILIAEDGGYFDEYAYRPIAYRMVGKCWVNNHAHILKANAGYDQGFIFYSLVHKNILSYLASGTRAKLNKSEMNKIELWLPLEQAEQTRIAAILSDMDAEIEGLEKKLDKYRRIKQGMMQELLTGKTRLI